MRSGLVLLLLIRNSCFIDLYCFSSLTLSARNYFWQPLDVQTVFVCFCLYTSVSRVSILLKNARPAALSHIQSNCFASRRFGRNWARCGRTDSDCHCQWRVWQHRRLEQGDKTRSICTFLSQTETYWVEWCGETRSSGKGKPLKSSLLGNADNPYLDRSGCFSFVWPKSGYQHETNSNHHFQQGLFGIPSVQVSRMSILEIWILAGPSGSCRLRLAPEAWFRPGALRVTPFWTWMWFLQNSTVLCLEQDNLLNCSS